MNEELTPAEARAAALLGDLRDATPEAEELPGAVTRHARWQRQVRHVLVSLGAAAGGIGGGLASFARKGR